MSYTGVFGDTGLGQQHYGEEENVLNHELMHGKGIPDCAALDEIQTVLPKFSAECRHVIHVFPQLQPEVLAVVFHAGVNQLMEEDKVDKTVGESGDFLVETDIVVCRTASPSALLIPDGNLVAGKAMFPGKTFEALPKKDFRLCP
ncbi:MAG: hypothetical protein PHY29_06255 [Syntrophales bacterium]|nr:hypothetical protein [Syntrophales bacterium]